MNSFGAIRVSSVVGFLGVSLGAFGAHGLEDILIRNQTLDIWQTAVLYHFIHAVVMFAIALAPGFDRSGYAGPWWSFLTGILVFSGSLYVLALTNLGWLGAITPIGGISFLIGWGWLVLKPGPGRGA